MTWQPWRTIEDRILREHYPRLGPTGCVPLLSGRTALAIYQRAHAKLGLATQSRLTYKSTEQIDKLIADTYHNRTDKGAVSALAKRIGFPLWWVTRRARNLGLVVPRFKEADWSTTETDLLHKHAHKAPEVIRRIFLKHGFRRSATAIIVKRKREHLDIHDPERYTATQLSHLMGVDAKVVIRWISHGLLEATRRGSQRTPQQGGDMYCIHNLDLRRFIFANPVCVDLRKVDRYWFLDLMRGAGDRAAAVRTPTEPVA